MKKLENYIGEMGKYGIKTGLTEAFVIDKEKAEILMKKNPRFENHIKPFLLGREIKPYLPAKPSNYLIKFEKGFTRENGGKNPEKWFESQFPEINTWSILKRRQLRELIKAIIIGNYGLVITTINSRNRKSCIKNFR